MARKRKAMTKKGVPGGDDDAGIGHNGGEPAELTDEQQRSLFLNHKQKYERALAAKKTVDADLKNVCKVIKSDGFAVEQIKVAIALDTPEGEAEERAKIQRALQAAKWVGAPLGSQLDMFNEPDRTPLTDRAYDQGRKASIEDKPARPHYAPETEAYAAYLSGYHDHQREIAGGFKAPARSPSNES